MLHCTHKCNFHRKARNLPPIGLENLSLCIRTYLPPLTGWVYGEGLYVLFRGRVWLLNINICLASDHTNLANLQLVTARERRRERQRRVLPASRRKKWQILRNLPTVLWVENSCILYLCMCVPSYLHGWYVLITPLVMDPIVQSHLLSENCTLKGTPNLYFLSKVHLLSVLGLVLGYISGVCELGTEWRVRMYQPMICTDQGSHQEVTLYVQCIFTTCLLYWCGYIHVYYQCSTSVIRNNTYTYICMYVCMYCEYVCTCVLYVCTVYTALCTYVRSWRGDCHCLCWLPCRKGHQQYWSRVGRTWALTGRRRRGRESTGKRRSARTRRDVVASR